MTAGIDEVIRHAKRGEEHACEQLFRNHAPAVYALTYKLTGHASDAEDLLQEAFLRAFRSLSDFRGESSFSTWLYRITVNAACDFFRGSSGKDRRRFVQVHRDGWEPPAGGTDDPPSRAVAREERSALLSALGELPEDHRLAVTLVYLEGNSAREAARALGANEKTLHSWLTRAREHLARVLGPVVDPDRD
jgi:RNA polymerase sigma-70 factor (ECF subfamily)